MATIDCATVVKRGYLVDKKGGLLERRRWFVLRQDYGQGYCILEHYKDEKSSLKGESPKGFINIYQVVEVRRTLDKKQTFELLCPGIAHRLMANSESEADEWVENIQRLSIFKREDPRSLSLQRVVPIMGGTPGGSLAGSPPKFPHTLPTMNSTNTTPTHPVHLIHNNNNDQSMQQLQQTFPTPPESVVTIAPPPFLKQNSLEAATNHCPYPSPPSSDSSSMCSGSNTSFDNNGTEGNEAEMCSKFRVHVKENEKLGAISGSCDVHISDEGISLHSIQTGYPLGLWPISSIRRYGVNNVCFTFETGRNCFTGEGKFFFYCPQSRLMHSRVHHVAQKKEQRRASAPDTLITSTHKTTPTPHHTLSSQQGIMSSGGMLMHHQMSSPSSLNMMSSSPPNSAGIHYNHIERTLRPNFSIEPYGKINTKFATPLSPPLAPPTYTAPAPPDYEKLDHTLSGNGSRKGSLIQAQTLPQIEQCNYVTIKHDNDEEEDMLSPIYSNVQLSQTQEVEDTPPPLPPRLAKMESI